MKIAILGILAIAAILLAGCTQPQACADDAKICPDGSSVARNASLGCDFNPCPAPPPLLGGDRDEHGCIGSAGYAWCPEKQKCLRVWEEDCPSLFAAALEAQAKGYCGSSNTVYICGEYIRVVSDMPGAGSKFYTLGNYDPVAACPLVAPDAQSEQCRLLLSGNNCVEQEVPCSAAPGAITDLADDPSFVGAQLSWSAPDANAVDYDVYRGGEGMQEVSLLATTGQASYEDIFDGGNQTYSYFIKARNADGVQGPESNVVEVKQLSTATQPSPGQID